MLNLPLQSVSQSVKERIAQWAKDEPGMELIGLLRNHAAILTVEAGNLIVESVEGSDTTKVDAARLLGFEAAGFSKFATLMEAIGNGQFDFRNIKQPTILTVYDQSPTAET